MDELEQKVLFETAKLAREKSFSIPVIDCFDEEETVIEAFMLNDELEFEEKLNYIDFYRNYNNQPKFEEYYDSKLYSRPTQTLLQKWLREIHNIEVYVTPVTPNSRDKYYQYQIHSISFGTGDTYESALEEGLLEGLKLI